MEGRFRSYEPMSMSMSRVSDLMAPMNLGLTNWPFVPSYEPNNTHNF